jgi:3D (Asp-Asp-Asp) domain-containing protein
MNDKKVSLFFILMFVFLAYPAFADSQHEEDKKSQLFATEVKFVRSTNYCADEKDADSDTKAGRNIAGVSISSLEKTGMGAVAVDPKEIPLGSVIIDNDGKKYLAIDTGKGVKKKKASVELARKMGFKKDSKEYKAPVCDFYGHRQIGKEWDHFTVMKYVGQKPFLAFSKAEKKQYINYISEVI